ncbi:MAG: GAF domain-containing protein, partial [Chloroflexi bacterium]|nr:GAF domain-containing protein [Chloroflexota bacterium]
SDMTDALRESRDRLEGMVEDERRKSTQFEALKDIAELGLVDGPTDELFQSLLERIIQAHEADGGSIYIHNQDNNMLEPLALRGIGESVMEPRVLRPDNGVVSKVMAEARSVVVEDYPNSPLAVNQRLKDLGVRTVVASPLIVGGQSIGAVSLHYKSPVSVEGSQLAMVELMAEGVAQVIERARLLELERQQAAELARMNEANVKMMQELELAQKRDIQSAKMAAMGQLAGGVAHEINNPLSSILGFAQLAKLKLPTNEFQPMASQQLSTLERYLRYINDEAKRCGQIVNKLQTFTRTPERDMASIDVNELLEQAERITTNETALSATRLETQFGDDLPLIKGNSVSLVQVFTNIITNATKAMPEEGGLLAVTSRLAQAKSAGGLPMVEVVFEDTGQGISEENISKVFEPFFTTADPGQGTGLGMYVCYQIVKQHDGEIDVYSQAGEGTTVVVKLPASEEEQEQRGLQSLSS